MILHLFYNRLIINIKFLVKMDKKSYFEHFLIKIILGYQILIYREYYKIILYFFIYLIVNITV